MSQLYPDNQTEADYWQDHPPQEMTPEEALTIVLDFVERWNKQDKEVNVAEAATLVSEYYLKKL